MPATEFAFTDPLPPALYLDNDVLVSYLVASEPHHARCLALLQRIAAERQTRVYVSSLSWLGFGHTVMRQNFQARLPAATQQQYALHQWQNRAVREQYLQAMLGLLDRLLAQFAWTEVSLTPSVSREALRLLTNYRLDSHDAAHLASAGAAGVGDLASLDAGYRRVDGLNLWNDLIYAVPVP